MAVWSTIAVSKLGHALRLEAEYYHPQYLAMNQVIVAAGASQITSYIEYVTDGTHITPHYVSDGIPFLSSSDIDSFIFPHDYERFISKSEHESLSHCQPKAGDLLISKSGRIGTCAVVPKRIKRGDVNIYEGLALVRVKGVDSHFLAAFVNSRYGQMQIRRELKGVAQPHLHLEDLRRMRVVIPNSEEVAAISMLVKKGMEADNNSHASYKSARELLSSGLKEEGLKFDHPLSYTANFSDVMRESRADADYFQVPYVELAQQIRGNTAGFVQLTEYCDFLSPNANPDKTPNEKFSYVELADINAGLGVIDACEKYRGSDLPSRARRRVKAGDVLASSVVGSIDKSAVIGKDQEGFIASTGFFHLRPKDVSTEFLLMLMRSTIVQMQLRQQATGGILSGVPDSRVKYIIVPKVNRDLQKEITAKVRAAHKKHKESLELLAAAKARVEELIESAVK